MNDNEQRFESLTQLLKLKQHEVPPPGYFNGFSSQVISAIQQQRSPVRKSSVSSSPQWLVNFLSIFDSRPGLVGGLATSMVLFLVLGVVLADHSDNEMASGYSSDASFQGASPLASATIPTEMAAADQNSSGGIAVSTNPVISLQPNSALFGPDSSMFQMASYAPAGAGNH
jgi:hypothetical protein